MRSSRPGKCSATQRSSTVAWPPRGITASRASSRIRSGLAPRGQPRQGLGREDEPDVPRSRSRRSASSVSTVNESPPRSTSIGLAASAGFSATASRTIASRCSAAVTGRPGLCGGCAAGTSSTRSRPRVSRASSAIARWPWWIGSNVPPRMPSEPATTAGGSTADAGAVSRGSVNGRPRADPTPARTRRCAPRCPARMPALRSAPSIPVRTSSRWNRSADSSFSKLVWATSRSMRLPRHAVARRPPGSTANPSLRPRAGGRRRRRARAARRARRRRAAAPATAARSASSPSPVSAEIATGSSPAARRLLRNGGQASRATGRSILLNATRIGFSSSAGSWAASSSRMTSWSHSGRERPRRRCGPGSASARRGAGTRGRARRPTTRPRSAPGRRRSSAAAPSSMPRSMTPRLGSSVVNG